jgi:hypothetical protein
MNTKACFIFGLVLVTAVALSACGPQNAPASSPQAWIDAPLQGSTIPLAPYQIIAHAGFPSGISQFELTITGQGPQTIPAPADQSGQTLVYINHMWTPPAPGLYLIQVRAASPEGVFGQIVEAYVQVGDVAAETPAPTSCTWTAAVNVFVRQGPGSSIYPEITAVEAGTTLPVVGQSQNQQFWAVQLSDLLGYIPKAERFGKVDGNCDLPILADPPTPVPSATPRAEPTSPPAPQCSDGIDNDGDGRTDFVAGAVGTVGDRQCRSADDNDEANP